VVILYQYLKTPWQRWSSRCECSHSHFLIRTQDRLADQLPGRPITRPTNYPPITHPHPRARPHFIGHTPPQSTTHKCTHTHTPWKS